LARGELVLIHVTVPLASAGTPGALIVERIGHAPSAHGWTTKEIWDAPADAAIPGRGFFALVAGSNLAEGERVLVSVPSGVPVAGVLIPADAMVLNGDRAWFYSAEAGDEFARHTLDISRPMDGGYFVTGVAAERNAVVQGAGLLLSRELNPSSSGE
jgi:hypothetical protein